jgi:hypothetical protein
LKVLKRSTATSFGKHLLGEAFAMHSGFFTAATAQDRISSRAKFHTLLIPASNTLQQFIRRGKYLFHIDGSIDPA